MTMFNLLIKMCNKNFVVREFRSIALSLFRIRKVIPRTGGKFAVLRRKISPP
jgi:hypothetical protein